MTLRNYELCFLFIHLLIVLSFFQLDWVEFSPYEIGMAKYGTFMSPGLFGSKFFMGSVVKQYEENPLHFLMGKTRNVLNFNINSDPLIYACL